MTDIDQLAFVVDAKNQRAKMLAAAARLSEADDNGFLLVAGLDLEPLFRALARMIQTCGTLRDNAFLSYSLRLVERCLAMPLSVPTIVDQWMASKDGVQTVLALKQWLTAQVAAIEEEQIEQ